MLTGTPTEPSPPPKANFVKAISRQKMAHENIVSVVLLKLENDTKYS